MMDTDTLNTAMKLLHARGICIEMTLPACADALTAQITD